MKLFDRFFKKYTTLQSNEDFDLDLTYDFFGRPESLTLWSKSSKTCLAWMQVNHENERYLKEVLHFSQRKDYYSGVFYVPVYSGQQYFPVEFEVWHVEGGRCDGTVPCNKVRLQAAGLY